MVTLFEQANWDDIFEDFRILTPKDKVRWNSGDDYGLGRHYYFLTGWHDEGVWTACYVRPRLVVVNRILPNMCNAVIGSFALCGKNRDRLIANDRLWIGRMCVAANLAGVPDVIQQSGVVLP